MDDLQQAYSAYQQALYHLSNPREPKLWYGIGILYDRYGSLEHAEEAFSQVMRMEPNFEKANEIYFRLGIIYKQQQKFSQSLEYDAAKAAYARVLDRDPNHAKVLQQLGWLHHQQSTSFNSQEQAIEYLEKSVNADQTDAQSWYLLGRCYMSQQKYPKAYEAYQQAVYRDGRNPTFWCSIGVLYYQINQYRDALDAYSRAIRLNPNISEVWYDLGTLARLALLKGQPTDGMPAAAAPLPQDVHPQAYQPGALGAPPGPQFLGTAANQVPPAGPPPPSLGGPVDWGNRRLADIQVPGQPPQTLGPYEGRERLPPHMPSGRQPSPPRQEPPRQAYQEMQRPPPPSHRGLSPSPKLPFNAPASYPIGEQPPPPQLPPQHQNQTPNRVANPNYPPQGPLSGAMSAPPPHLAGPPYGAGRIASPAPEVRPINDAGVAPSPNGSYQRQSYQPYGQQGLPSITGGAPPPLAAVHAAEAAAREREERPPATAPKRHREWEEDNSSKRHANDEARSRQEDANSRRPSPPDKIPSSPQRGPSEARRAEELRLPPNDGYHPSEAAHHQPLPPISQSQEPSPRSAAPVEERREQPTPTPANAVRASPQTQYQGSPTAKSQHPGQHPGQSATQPPPPPPQQQQQQQQQQLEPAARKMDMDENYDDSGDEEKKGSSVKGESKRNSPGESVSANGNGAQHTNGVTSATPASRATAAES
ncbi:hypothetical protein ANO11243_023890 [Dothideomycetidae sp. 11243]|nr:hypothetical protein ANO11243_023890 [fungal sp. No.11243]